MWIKVSHLRIVERKYGYFIDYQHFMRFFYFFFFFALKMG